jgi:hypothetical protein
MASRLKPIPKNQAEISQERITPYLKNQGQTSNGEDVFSKNRGMDLSFKNDDVKDVSIGLQDIDNAVIYYFENIIKPTVIQDGNRIAVPLIYGLQLVSEHEHLIQSQHLLTELFGLVEVLLFFL